MLLFIYSIKTLPIYNTFQKITVDKFENSIIINIYNRAYRNWKKKIIKYWSFYKWGRRLGRKDLGFQFFIGKKQTNKQIIINVQQMFHKISYTYRVIYQS